MKSFFGKYLALESISSTLPLYLDVLLTPESMWGEPCLERTNTLKFTELDPVVWTSIPAVRGRQMMHLLVIWIRASRKCGYERTLINKKVTELWKRSQMCVTCSQLWKYNELRIHVAANERKSHHMFKNNIHIYFRIIIIKRHPKWAIITPTLMCKYYWTS